MILNILGAGGSGKTSLKFFLKKQKGFYTFVTLTTREKRNGEIDGIHYKFVTIDKFKKDKNIAMVRDMGKGRLYGNKKDDITNHKNITVTTLDVNGVKQLKSMGLPVSVVYLDISEKERRKRMLERGDDLRQVLERLKIDRFAFQEFDLSCPMLKISEGSIEDIFKKIKNFLKNPKRLSAKDGLLLIKNYGTKNYDKK